jgi:hypothetical protein
LQDVAVNGSNVGDEHAPEHALNLFTYKYSLNRRFMKAGVDVFSME